MDPEVYDETVRLKDESSTFCEKVSQIAASGEKLVSKIEFEVRRAYTHDVFFVIQSVN